MSEATISFADHDQIRTLFGTGDEHLRRVRETVGIDVVIRGDDVKLRGTDEQVRHGCEVFEELREIVERQGYLRDSEVSRVLGDGADTAETSLGARLMQSGVQLVLAMGYSVTVSAAELLMTRLYQELYQGKSVAQAIRLARRALAEDKKRSAYFR